jgi:hypothetical protein
MSAWSEASARDLDPAPVVECGRVPEFVAYCDAAVAFQRRNILGETRPEDKTDLEARSAALEPRDSHYYFAHVIHALAFMAKGYWRPAITLARLAMQICDGIREEDRGAQRGREAAYLASIATRHSAMGVADLEKARGYVAEAVERDDREGYRDLRFVGESLALDERELLFERFVTGDRLDPARLKVVVGKLADLVIDLQSEDAVNAAASGEQPLKLEEARNWILRESLTNLLTLLLISKSDDPGTIAGLDVATLLSVFDSVLAEGESRFSVSPTFDRVAYLVRDVAGTVFDADSSKRGSAAKRALDIMGSWGPAMRPYDEGRLALFRAIAQEATAGGKDWLS